MRVRSTWPWTLFVAALCACGPAASAHYAGMSEYKPSNGLYTLRYLAPPWELKTFSGYSATLQIERVLLGIVDADVPGKYELAVSLVPASTGATAAMLAMKDAAEATSRGESLVVAPRPITTDSGDPGVDVVTKSTDPNFPRSLRYVSFDSPKGVIRLVFQADPDLANPEVDAMIHAFDVNRGTP